MNGPNKLECYITLSWKGFPGTNSLAYWANRELQRKNSVVNKVLDAISLIHFEGYVPGLVSAHYTRVSVSEAMKDHLTCK
jgi:hypothetical protein